MQWPPSNSRGASTGPQGWLGTYKKKYSNNKQRDRIDIEIPIYEDQGDFKSNEIETIPTKDQNDHFGNGFHRRKHHDHHLPQHEILPRVHPQSYHHPHPHLRSQTPPRFWHKNRKKSNDFTRGHLLRNRLMKWIIARQLTPLRCTVYVVLALQAIVVLHLLLVLFNPFPTFISLLPTSVIQKQLTVTPKNETALMLPGMELNYKCVAWRSTSNCNPEGPRLSDSTIISTFIKTDLGCDQVIPTMGSGYCELQSPSGEIIKAFKKPCREGYPRLEQYQPFFKCDMAASFVAYKDRALNYEPYPVIAANDIEGLEPTRGIVMGVYPKVLASAYAIIKALQELHDCQLPIELWCVRGELTEDNPLIRKILLDGKTHLRFINDDNVHSYMVKPYSIAYSKFDQVLFLDSDNFPIRDPSYLFDTPEFQSTGALFWKDYWIASRDEFFITKKSLVWELLGIPPDSPAIREQEMESGQIVIDRRKGEKALKVLLFLAKTFPDFIEPLSLLLGDKDLFRLAWYMTNSPFHYAKDPPGMAGPAPLPLLSKDAVCGLSFVQHDPSGEPLFLHRNFAKFVQERSFLKRYLGIFFGSPIHPTTVWKKGVKFIGDDPESQYAISSFVSLWQENMCYHPRADVREYFEEIDYRGTEIEDLDNKVLAWALEGMQINS